MDARMREDLLAVRFLAPQIPVDNPILLNEQGEVRRWSVERKPKLLFTRFAVQNASGFLDFRVHYVHLSPVSRATVAFLQYSLSLLCETTTMRMRTNIRIALTECYDGNDKEATHMSTHATGTFEFKSWDEKPYSEIDGGPKLTHASVANMFRGDIEGEGKLAYLMMYPDDTSATFVGMERVVGRVGDRSGSFVLQHRGTFENGAAKGTVSVLPGSGTGDLRGLRGEGAYVAKEGQSRTAFTLDYDLA